MNNRRRQAAPVSGGMAAFGCLVGLGIVVINIVLFALSIAIVVVIVHWLLALAGVVH